MISASHTSRTRVPFSILTDGTRRSTFVHLSAMCLKGVPSDCPNDLPIADADIMVDVAPLPKRLKETIESRAKHISGALAKSPCFDVGDRQAIIKCILIRRGATLDLELIQRIVLLKIEPKQKQNNNNRAKLLVCSPLPAPTRTDGLAVLLWKASHV